MGMSPNRIEFRLSRAPTASTTDAIPKAEAAALILSESDSLYNHLQTGESSDGFK